MQKVEKITLQFESQLLAGTHMNLGGALSEQAKLDQTMLHMETALRTREESRRATFI